MQVASKSASRADINDVCSRLGGSRFSRLGGLENGELEELQELQDEGRCRWLPYAVRNAVGEMIDLGLLLEPCMLLMCVSNVVGMLGFYVPLVFIIDLAAARGVPKVQGTMLLSAIGVANTLGRVFFGWVADRRWLSALSISNGSLLLCGLLTTLCFLLDSYALLLAYAVSFGFVIGRVRGVPDGTSQPPTSRSPPSCSATCWAWSGSPTPSVCSSSPAAWPR